MQKIETAIIIVALASLWPWLAGFHAWWYRVWLLAVLAALAWVTVRRLARTRDAAAEAKRKRDDAERGGRPPWLG